MYASKCFTIPNYLNHILLVSLFFLLCISSCSIDFTLRGSEKRGQIYLHFSRDISLPPSPKEIIHLSFKSKVRIVKTNYSLSHIHYIHGNIYILVNITKKSKLTTRQYPNFKVYCKGIMHFINLCYEHSCTGTHKPNLIRYCIIFSKFYLYHILYRAISFMTTVSPFSKFPFCLCRLKKTL